MIKDIITMSVDCYDCGNKIEFDYRVFHGAAAYEYCSSCHRGIQVYYNGDVLFIDVLSEE